MRLPFLRTQERDEPLIVAMSGVRLGDNVLFWGGRSELLLPLAARSGLSGRVVVLSENGPTLKATAERAGLLVEAESTPPTGESFDLAVIHTQGPWTTILPALAGSVRHGGRVIVVSGTLASGLMARLRGTPDGGPAEGEIVQTLHAAGWTRVRGIGEREGLRFVEGVRG